MTLNFFFFFDRYDYENVESAPANLMMNNLRQLIASGELSEINGYVVRVADDFRYVDPIDESISEKQVCYNVALICSTLT